MTLFRAPTEAADELDPIPGELSIGVGRRDSDHLPVVLLIAAGELIIELEAEVAETVVAQLLYAVNVALRLRADPDYRPGDMIEVGEYPQRRQT